MNELMKRCLELEALQVEIHHRIHQIKVIMIVQECGSFDMPTITNYRYQYYKQLIDHRRIIRRQQMELIDRLEIEEIVSVMLKD